MGEWIELAYGEFVPAPNGTLIELHWPNGATAICRVGDQEAKTSTGVIAHIPKVRPTGMWADKWRPISPDTDDKAKREARIERFREIAAGKDQIIEETLKPREKVK